MDIQIYYPMLYDYHTPSGESCDILADMFRQKPRLSAFSEMSSTVQTIVALMLAGV